MRSKRIFAVAIAFAMCVAALAAPSPVGKWKGRIKFNHPEKIPAQYQPKIIQAQKSIFSFEFKPDKTFVASNGKLQIQKGTWSESGNILTMTVNRSSQQLQYSKDHKTLTSTMGGATLTLTRA